MRAGVLMLAALAGGCASWEVVNYDDPSEPRHAADHRAQAEVAPVAGDALRVVTYNLKFGEQPEAAVTALADIGFDVVLMQEMDAAATDHIARALGLAYVYYPASVHESGRDFGNAVLSRWPIIADAKLMLPHSDPVQHRIRPATVALVDVDGLRVAAYSVHTSIPTLPLGHRLEQAERLFSSAASHDVVVVGGDFNTLDPGSVSATVELAASRGLRWASRGAGDTHGALGGRALDHVFVRGLEPSGTGVYDGEAGSDHRPLWVAVTSAARASRAADGRPFFLRLAYATAHGR